jgi:hypothetical protein
LPSSEDVFQLLGKHSKQFHRRISCFVRGSASTMLTVRRSRTPLRAASIQSSSTVLAT